MNGLLIAYTQVPSFALTLGTLGILQAASLVISDATTVYVTANSDVLAPLFGSAHRCSCRWRSGWPMLAAAALGAAAPHGRRPGA